MSDEEWVKSLKIPGIALPGLRDLRIQFIALLEFDRILGAVVYLNELSRGSSYIKKLKNVQTLSEVYAGAARSPQHTISTLEEDIAVFRYQVEGDTDTVNVLFISCIPDTNLDPVREIGQKSMFRAKGRPDLIGGELSSCLREKLDFDSKFKTIDEKIDLIIWDKNRIQMPLNLDHVKGLVIYDLESKIADIRFLPFWVDGKELHPKIFLRYIDNQLSSIASNTVTSMLYHSIPFLATKVKNKDVYIIVNIDESSFVVMKQIAELLNPIAEILSSEWKLSSQNEILNGLTMFNHANKRNTPYEYQKKFTQMLLRSDRIKPYKGKGIEIPIDPPEYINDDIWDKLASLDGELSIAEIAKKWNLELIEAVTLFEWARVRNLVIFLQE